MGLAAGPERLGKATQLVQRGRLLYESQRAVPRPNGALCLLRGILGGIFLGLGLLSRITALVLTVNMFVAYVTADREALLSVSPTPISSMSRRYTFLIASVIVLLFGPGRFALDAFLRWLVMTAEEFFTYDVSKSGQRFLINGNAERTDPHPFDIVLNWKPKLNK